MSNNTNLVKKILIAAAFLVCIVALATLSRERAAANSADQTTESITEENSTAESGVEENTTADSSVTEENQ